MGSSVMWLPNRFSISRLTRFARPGGTAGGAGIFFHYYLIIEEWNVKVLLTLNFVVA